MILSHCCFPESQNLAIALPQETRIYWFGRLDKFSCYFAYLINCAILLSSQDLQKHVRSNSQRAINSGRRLLLLWANLNDANIRQIIEKHSHDPIFQGTLNQLEIFRQLKQHLTNEVTRYRKANRGEIASLILDFMADS